MITLLFRFWYGFVLFETPYSSTNFVLGPIDRRLECVCCVCVWQMMRRYTMDSRVHVYFHTCILKVWTSTQNDPHDSLKCVCAWQMFHWCIYVCACVFTRAHIDIWTSTQINPCIYIPLRPQHVTYTYFHVCVCMCMYMCRHIHIPPVYIHICVHKRFACMCKCNAPLHMYICKRALHLHMHAVECWCTHSQAFTHTGRRKPIGCLKLQVSFRKRAINYRAILRKMTYKDKASYASSPPYVHVHIHVHK